MLRNVAAAVVLVSVIGGGAIYVHEVEQRVAEMEDLIPVPTGTMVPYFLSGAIPEGWVPCGAEGTPEMNGRFIIGTNEAREAGASVPEDASGIKPSADGDFRSGDEVDGRPTAPPELEGADNYTGKTNWNHKHDVRLPMVKVRFLCKQ